MAIRALSQVSNGTLVRKEELAFSKKALVDKIYRDAPSVCKASAIIGSRKVVNKGGRKKLDPHLVEKEKEKQSSKTNLAKLISLEDDKGKSEPFSLSSMSLSFDNESQPKIMPKIEHEDDSSGIHVKIENVDHV